MRPRSTPAGARWRCATVARSPGSRFSSSRPYWPSKQRSSSSSAGREQRPGPVDFFQGLEVGVIVFHLVKERRQPAVHFLQRRFQPVRSRGRAALERDEILQRLGHGGVAVGGADETQELIAPGHVLTILPAKLRQVPVADDVDDFPSIVDDAIPPQVAGSLEEVSLQHLLEGSEARNLLQPVDHILHAQGGVCGETGPPW